MHLYFVLFLFPHWPHLFPSNHLCTKDRICFDFLCFLYASFLHLLVPHWSFFEPNLWLSNALDFTASTLHVEIAQISSIIGSAGGGIFILPLYLYKYLFSSRHSYPMESMLVAHNASHQISPCIRVLFTSFLSVIPTVVLTAILLISQHHYFQLNNFLVNAIWLHFQAYFLSLLSGFLCLYANFSCQLHSPFLA